MSRSAVETALQAYVVAATGLDDSRVIFSEQHGNAPPADGQPAVTVCIGDAKVQGVDYATQVAENDTTKTLTVEARGQRELLVTFRGFSPNAYGDQTAAALLDTLSIQAAFDGARDDLNASGIGLNQLGTVQSIPKVVSAGWESQAILEWRCCLLVTAQQTVPYIAHVNGTGTVLDPAGDVAATIPFSVDLP